MVRDKKQEFWNTRAPLGETSGTNDFVLKDLELKLIHAEVPTYSTVLDAGCGNGATLVSLALRNNCRGVGIDFSNEMIKHAKDAAIEGGVSDRISFLEGRIEEFPDLGQEFDVVLTERSLQNLNSAEAQHRAFLTIMRKLRPGGIYLMIESFIQGVNKTNGFRQVLGLDPISPPWHNLFLDEEIVQTWETSTFRLEAVNHFSSTYYFLSRVVYAKIAADNGDTLRYDSPINLIGKALPPVGDFGPTRLYKWRRIQ
ncbi:MAG: class I SAM-dependent methyltransferase [candidate division WOR-3 bacterium]